MATWPSESTLFNTSITGADANPLMKTWLETNKQIVGAVAPVTLRIGNGSITPTAANILVDTEGGAAADTLSVIATSKMHDGAIILLRSADSSRKVTVQHSTGMGGLATVDAKNITLDTEWPLLACLVGDRWQEIAGGRRAYDAIVPPDGVTIKTVDGELKAIFPSPYELCEFYFFRHPTLKPGFQPCMGGLLANAATLYPDAWAYLQTAEGRMLCTTEAEWQAMTTAIWHTNADGTTVGWNGIGGAPFYALNTATGALRLPDLRGMYIEAAGFDYLDAGCTHGDASRNIWGRIALRMNNNYPSTGAFSNTNVQYPDNDVAGSGKASWYFDFDGSRVAPVAAKNQPRAWGALACVYLGSPAS